MANLQLNSERDIARASTLPAPVYFNSATFEEEKTKIFAATWQAVGHVHQVASPGDYFTFDLIGEPLLIVRGDDGILRCFYNVCRHRAGNPASGCGNRKLFRCGYHGWTYRLDGALLVTPEFDGVENFDPVDFGLVSVRIEEWFNLIFVNLDREASPLSESLGELPAQAEKFDFAGMKFSERRTYEMNCNWKTYIDNYLEGYHLPSVHPALNREINYNAYTVEPIPNTSASGAPSEVLSPETPHRAATSNPTAAQRKTSPLITSGPFPTGCLTATPITSRSTSSCRSAPNAHWQFSSGICPREI